MTPLTVSFVAAGTVSSDVPGDLSNVTGFKLYDGGTEVADKPVSAVANGKISFDVQKNFGDSYDYFVRAYNDSDHATGVVGQ